MIELVRIDDRLVHAQVVVGWLQHLKCDMIVVVDTGVAADSEHLDMFEMILPEGIGIEGITTGESATYFDTANLSDSRYIFLFKDPVSLLESWSAGFRHERINVGGMHLSNGRKAIGHGLFGTEVEIGAMKTLISSGARLEVQSIPAIKAYVLEEDDL